jgi:hypothetical protein
MLESSGAIQVGSAYLRESPPDGSYRMRKISIVALTLILVAGTWGCAKRSPKTTVRIPPRVDLTQLEVIGVVEFDSSAEPELESLVTQSFTAEARRDQGLVRMVELGPNDDVLASVGQSRWNRDSYKALGTEHGVHTILVGTLTLTEARPSISLSPSLESGSVSALIKATLAVQLVEASSGASVWSSSASASRSVGNISVSSGKDVVLNARDPKSTYGPLVDDLVEQVTRDFKATWVRR